MDEVGRGSRLPDLVYPVKNPGEELRYSLRSVAQHAPGLFGRVWLVGDRPEWVTGVGHIVAGNPVNRGEDVRAKIAAACAHPEVAETFVLMNDDYFLVDPIDSWQPYHMGTMADWLGRLSRRTDTSSAWLRYVTETASWVEAQGVVPMAWQGHRPLAWDARRLAETLDRYPRGRALDVVGLYDLAGADGPIPRRGCNSKVGIDPRAFHDKLAELDIPWISSNDRSFAEGMVGGYIRGMFRTASRFEVTP